MPTELQFPTVTVFGRFFNDFLSGLNLFECYKSYVDKMEADDDMLIFPLEDVSGILFAGYHKDQTAWVACDIGDAKTIASLILFADRHFDLYLNGEFTTVYRHRSSGVFFSVLRHTVKCKVPYTFQLCKSTAFLHSSVHI